MPQFFSPNNLMAARAAMLLNPTAWAAGRAAGVVYPYASRAADYLSPYADAAVKTVDEFGRVIEGANAAVNPGNWFAGRVARAVYPSTLTDAALSATVPGNFFRSGQQVASGAANLIYPPPIEDPVSYPISRSISRDAAFGVPAGPIQTVEVPSGPMDVAPPQPTFFNRNPPMQVVTVPDAQVPAMPVDQAPMEVGIVPYAQVPAMPVDQPDSPAANPSGSVAIPAGVGNFFKKLMSGMGKGGGAGGGGGGNTASIYDLQRVPEPLPQNNFFGTTLTDLQSAMTNYGAPQGAAMASRAASQANLLGEQARADAARDNAEAQRGSAREALQSRETTAKNELAQRAKEAEESARLEEKRLGILATQAKERADNIPVAVAKIEAETKAMQEDQKKAANDLVVTAQRDLTSKLASIADAYEKAAMPTFFPGMRSDTPIVKEAAATIRSGDINKIKSLFSPANKYFAVDTNLQKAYRDVLAIANASLKASPVGAAVEFDPETFGFRVRQSPSPSGGSFFSPAATAEPSAASPAPVTFASPDDVKAAMVGGSLTKEQAAQILRQQFGFQ